ncbi:MAG TPA: flagellar basal body L-ring protein FlgH [Geobacteraceae bacterium]|nr:flagellar basal body L-ring protein FlgH [Geobacteraceae bacterium]
MRKSAIAIIALLASGCVYPQVEMPRQSFEEHVPAPQPRYESGSLWQENSVSLVDDYKARRRGDIVTVLIVEEASASKQANTGTKRETGISASIPNFMGIETTALADKLDLNALVKANTSSSYDGSGSTSRKDVLKATITARVMDVLPNGYLRIQGQRSVKVNNEEQIIILEGVVRPKDINHENMISSAQVADARITYAGNGIVNDKQQPGWLFNFVDKIWPF